MDQRTSPSDRSFLTVGEVAEWPGCTEPMVWKLKTTRQIASVKVGRLVRFQPSDGDANIQSRRAGGAR
jgi:excisionase family DNA binding protein